MPTYDRGTAAAAQTAPDHGPWPDEVASIAATEHASTRDDGTVRRGVLVSWTPPETGLALRGFRVVWREVGEEQDDEVWVQACDAGPAATSLLILDRFRIGGTYEFASIPIGPLCCLRRPPSACRIRATLQLVGEQTTPAAPTGLRLVQIGDRTLFQWDPVEQPGLTTYEVRYGPDQWDQAELIGRTAMTEIELSDLPPVGHVASAPAVALHVAAMTATGLFGSSAALTGQSIEWGPAEDVGPAQLSDGSWSGMQTGCEVVAGELVLSDGETAATYLAPIHDAGAVLDWRLFVLTRARQENAALSPYMTPFAPLDRLGAQWSPLGGTDESYPTDALPLVGSLAPLESGAAPLDTPDESPIDPRDGEVGDFGDLAPFDSGFAPLDDVGASASPLGGIDSTEGTGYLVEVQFADTLSSWSAWEPYARQIRSFRYARARLTLTQPAPALQLVVEDLCVFVVRSRPKALADVVAAVAGLGTVVEDETPSGVIDGVNDSYTLAHTPIGNPQLFKSGALQRRGATGDFTISGSTITYAPASKPAPGDWHRVWYRY